MQKYERFNLGNIKLLSGKVLKSAKLIYKTYGKLNKDCSNDFHEKIRKLMKKDQDNIVIIGGNLNLYLKNTFVTEINGSNNWWYKFKPIDPSKNIKSSIIDSINEITVTIVLYKENINLV